METIKITCPKCGSRLTIPKLADYKEKLIECPSCHFEGKGGVYGGETELYDAGTASTIGQIRVPSTGQVFQLKMGRNTIGRKAASSKADFQISGDPYMSRSQVCINVMKPGVNYEHHLIEVNATNRVLCNTKALERGDIIILNHGDRLTLGKTDVIFEIKGNPDETLLLK